MTGSDVAAADVTSEVSCSSLPKTRLSICVETVFVLLVARWPNTSDAQRSSEKLTKSGINVIV